jgi:hypothetical protein
MKKIVWFWIGCFLLVAGCDEDSSPPTTGEVTITSELVLEGDTYTFNGFSFELGKVVYCNPQSCKIEPDLIVIPDNSGEEIIAYLEILNNVQEKPLMALAAEFADWNSALDFFNNYNQIADSLSYSFWAKPALEYQVWVVKTLRGKYGKIAIKNVVTYLNGTKPYAEITFKWAYQPDGSTLFD